MGARNRVIVPARQATKAGGIHSLESIPGLHKRLKIRAPISSSALHNAQFTVWTVFVNHLRSPGIDSQPGGLVRHPYLSYRPTRARILNVNWAQESIPPAYVAESEFFKLLWSPGTDSNESMPSTYVSRRAGTKPYSYSVPIPNRLFKNSSPVYISWRNRFLGP